MPVCATRYQKKENPGSRINSGFRAKKRKWRRRDSNHYLRSPKPLKERIFRVSLFLLFSKLFSKIAKGYLFESDSGLTVGTKKVSSLHSGSLTCMIPDFNYSSILYNYNSKQRDFWSPRQETHMHLGFVCGHKQAFCTGCLLCVPRDSSLAFLSF